MQAMVYRGSYKIRVEEKDVPPIEHPNDAIVKVSLAAICGWDLHLYHGMMPDTRVGMTFGHEFVGVVHDVGPSVRNLQPGDRVMVPFDIFCGSCYFCARGLYANCHNVNSNATAVGGHLRPRLRRRRLGRAGRAPRAARRQRGRGRR
jgi:alcohol dehydrogenase